MLSTIQNVEKDVQHQYENTSQVKIYVTNNNNDRESSPHAYFSNK